MVLLLLYFLVSVGAENFENQCGFDRLILQNRQSNFATAQAYCRSNGLNIVRINNNEQNSCIRNLADGKNMLTYWIDGNDIKTEGIFLDSDNNKLKYLNWNHDQPNNYNNNQNCIGVLNKNEFWWTWFDTECDGKFGIICSSNINSNNGLSSDNMYHFLEMEDIFNNGFMKMIFHKYSLTQNSLHVKLVDEYNKTGNSSIICNMGELIHIFVEMKNINKELKFPFNISCGIQKPQNIIRNLTIIKERNSINIFWNIIKKGIHDYIIFLMNNEDYVIKHTKSENTLYSWDNVGQSNWQQICIATIDNKWRTSKYTCSHYSVYPGPVVNLRAYSMKNMIYVSWDKSQEDIHQGYAVNVTSSSGHCQTTIINMEFYNVNVKERCRYHSVIRWTSFKLLIIRNTIPGNKYRVSVSSIKGNYSSLPTILVVKTNIKETVKDLRVSTNSSHILIKFGAPRGTEEFIIKYHVKVTLHGRNMCLFKYKVIFDELITETYKFITTHLLMMCFHYEVEVVPVRQYGDQTNSVLLDIQNIDYYPSKKEGFLYNNTEKPTVLKDLNVSLLSVNILKLTWSNNMPQNDCSHFGFMIESISLENKSDCKTWIITRTSCTALINDIEKETKCKNKEYLTLQNKWINKTLLLHGQFDVMNTYKIKVWDMTDQIRLLLMSEVMYNDKSECLDDCYGPKYNETKPAKINTKICQEWKRNLNIKKFSRYNSNICYIDKYSNLLPLCYNKDNSHTVNCDTQQCETSSKDKNCDYAIQLYPSVESITVNLSLRVTKDVVKGHIVLLHNREHKCERYVVKTCTNCIDLLKLKTQIQRFFTSCREGSVKNDLINETTFNGLQNNQQYILYVIPLLDSTAFGKILNVTTATRLSDPMIPSYIKVQNIENTSLQFTWNSYKKQSYSSSFDHYSCILVNMMTNEEILANYTEEMAKFSKLESCTKYCLYINTVDIRSQIKLVDHICTFTFSSNLGVITIEDIESSPSLSRLISWTHSGGDGCTKTYRVELHNVYLNKTVNMTTNGTTLHVNDLEKNMIYEVKVRMESFIRVETSINSSQYSKMKRFFTGQVNIKITNVLLYIDSSRKKLNIWWALEDAASGSVQSFIIRVNNTADTCLSSITFVFQPPMNIHKKTLANQNLLKRWQSLSKCTQSTKKNFSIHREDFAGTISSSGVLDNNTLSIYGLNVLGIHKLYEKTLE